MKPQMQTTFDKGQGNCTAACVASILEMPIEDVPNFALHGWDWAEHLDKWLAERGYQVIAIIFENWRFLTRTWMTPNQFVMVSGVSPRAEGDSLFRHAVVGRTYGHGIEIVHDPHPSRDGISKKHDIWVRFIVPLGETQNNGTL